MDSKRSTEEKVDTAVKETFPASDPLAVTQPPDAVKTTQPPQPPKRSPDWMFDRK